MEVEQLVGRALNHNIDADIDAFIERRHQQRVKAEGERREEEAWKESTRKHAETQRQQARLEWHLHHTTQAQRLRRTPGAAQLHNRSERAMRPPKASPEDLAPTTADLEAARDRALQERARRLGFFNRPAGTVPRR